MNVRFVVAETTTMDDVLAAGLPDPLYCERGSADHARRLADRIDAERGGATSCGGSEGSGCVPDIVENEG
ncbi:MAG: hypothetical protein WBX49_11365 [Candidatus Deferrimicrobiaceae bacterium]